MVKNPTNINKTNNYLSPKKCDMVKLGNVICCFFANHAELKGYEQRIVGLESG